VGFIVGVLVVALVLAIAAGAIGREARRLDALPPRAVFDVDEAVEWVADHLPDDVTAELSYEQVRTLLDFGLDHLRTLGVAGRTGERVEGEVVVSEADAVAAVFHRAHEAMLELTPYQVQQVVTAQLGYLQSISAVGPPADDE
jgi:hypothetical protein